MTSDRAQLSIPAIEIGIGMLLILAVVSLVIVSRSGPSEPDPQLAYYAADTATILLSTGTETTPPIGQCLESQQAFHQQCEKLTTGVNGLLPDYLLYHIDTPYGTVGYEPPENIETVTRVRATPHGSIAVTIYYV